MIEREMILMDAMRTENNLDITEEQILNSLHQSLRVRGFNCSKDKLVYG